MARVVASECSLLQLLSTQNKEPLKNEELPDSSFVKWDKEGFLT